MRSLGEGGIAEVFEAVDLSGARERVAIKLMKDEAGGHSSARTRSFREATHLARVSHPNVVRVRDVFEHAGKVALVLDLVEGGTLADRLRQGPLTAAEMGQIGRGVLAGLAAVHSENLVHRDIKPSNVLLTRNGEPKLADLGIAFAIKDIRNRATRQGGTVGTPEFMSPEQIRGRAIDHRSDIYSFGVLLFLLVSGDTPFFAENEYAIMKKHVDEPVPVDKLAGRADERLVSGIVKALAKQPQDRWNDVLEMRKALGWWP